ncbi:ABC transporter ATP-binding protein [Ampullimonas aquatilis]|uniref:ABC transporter ATP-binding protein n=1 Tax=Ampullimonas aquatilis TaxID=1341549 RepID=UPI003C743C34
MIEVIGLNKVVTDSSGDLVILKNISFKVEQGQTVALVGVSGSGKSTLLGLLAGLDVPTSGSVSINQQQLFGMNEDARALFRAEQIGFVFQSFQLLPHLTALENVLLPLELKQDFDDARGRAIRMLQEVGLGERLNQYPSSLSGGEQQRVALARAFICRPKLLLADEPTGSLDPATGARIMSLMLALNRQSGATLILVTHDPAVAKQCQRVITIHAGQIEQDVLNVETQLRVERAS